MSEFFRMRGRLMFTLILASALLAGEADATVQFEPPVRLRVGDDYMGVKRMYPSPAVFDIDGDKQPELVIGDLMGRLTVSRRDGDSWTAESALEGADGKPLKFDNW